MEPPPPVTMQTLPSPVDKDAAIAAGILDEAERDRMVEEVRLSVPNSYLTKDYLMMLDLLAHFDWKRPISFTQPYIMRDYGISQYARYDGFCYTFVPIKTENRDGNAGYLNHEKLYPLFMGEEVEGSLQHKSQDFLLFVYVPEPLHVLPFPIFL